MIFAEKHKSEARGKTYTNLQEMAKRHDLARYQYNSWGGSTVEDMMDVLISFAILSCFGIVLPSVSVIVFITHIVVYRLKAFRAVNVTSRPTPEGLQAFEVWQDAFETVSLL